VALDASGNVHTVGRFSGTVDFDPSASTANLTAAAAGSDAFVWKLSPDFTSGACCTALHSLRTCVEELTRDECAAQQGLYVGPETRCDDPLTCEALLVTMESMSAESTASGVLVAWTTASEVDSVGFRVLRESADSRDKTPRAVSPFIPTAGNSLAGATYSFLDDTKGVWSGRRYYIEDIDIFGRVTRHGPIQVQGRTGDREAAGLRIKEGANR
jgi:hypothetical protein